MDEHEVKRMMDGRKRSFRHFVICLILMGILVLGSAVIVTADEPPVADADPDHQTVKAGEEVRFTGSASYDPDGSIVSYYWDFGDGLCYEGETVAYTFNAVGNFSVYLTVVDDGGNQDTDCVTVEVVEEEPPSELPTVWIESLETDKGEYEINETVDTQVIVQRGCDPLTYVWEGTLVLEVLDDLYVMVFTEERAVYLPTGGSSETHDFEFELTESGDYQIRAVLYDLNDEFVDSMETYITVGDGGTPPPNGCRMVWIESLTTDKYEYEINEIVNTQVIVERGYDLLTYVWEGTLVLEVIDDASIVIFTDSREVYLPCGGMTEIHDFEYSLTETGDYLVRATLYDLNDELTDTKEIWIKVGDDNSGGTLMVWIESLATDKYEYEVNEAVTTEVIVKRGDDALDYVWEGFLILEVFDEDSDLIYSDKEAVTLACGGMTQTLNFEFTLTETGKYIVRATLFDIHDELMDTKEVRITVGGDGTPPPNDGDGTKPPNCGDKMVWIESLTTDKQEYNVNELVNTQVTVKRGYDLLTYVWEGTLVLEVLDDASVVVFTDSADVYLPGGGMSEIHEFEYTLSELGEYLVRATLYDMNDELVDTKEMGITVCGDPSGGDGTDPSNAEDASDDNGWGFFSGGKAGAFQTEGGMQMAMLTIVSIALLALFGFASVRYVKRSRNRKAE